VNEAPKFKVPLKIFFRGTKKIFSAYGVAQPLRRLSLEISEITWLNGVAKGGKGLRSIAETNPPLSIHFTM